MDNEKYNLIIEAKNGNKASLEKLLKAEQKNIKGMLFYLSKDIKDISDIMQEILVKISKKIYQLKNPNSFKTWLNQIVINSFYDYLRKEKRRDFELQLKRKDEEVFLETPDYSTNPSDSILNNELDYIVKTSISNLPIHYKIPITLREIQGLSYEEISNVTNSTIGTVKSRIARARAMIKNDIDRYTRN